ncbi:MAG: ribosome small subunit-dependent GTPase A [candidate division Zixibacteria bacterium]|nr:ribosome small subunit-dependent GTPase A [candidate division Zixibacteria bacterium]NIR65156.1 ribosome small subunit-dependent GTPase A [candidate division Zixibacteria bacterium]NIS14706.1 ribosome small subunit-dependent GTPase A [candidate division Zixibacteria bacterium]NIS46890.1 ribosome small subunit-dependent GTPase A [candidate division Zixibacteria bacterium]NIT51234.1 ribosome small subunit-dependent GTPase A [candidate division Zixibacteria bacterium]
MDVELLVDIDPGEELKKKKTYGAIINIHPRRSKFSRPKRGKEEIEQIVAANIEQMMIISSVKRPQFKMGLIDRFLIAAHQGSLEPIIVLNKIDLEHALDLNRLENIYKSINVRMITTSATQKINLDEFKEVLKDKHSIVVGQSGTGKSSLLNAVEKGLRLKVGDVSDYSQKGTHTTAAVEMYPLSFGGYVVDTPGLKYLGLWNIEAEDLRYLYPEIAEYSEKCKFRNCLHISEPGCAVKEAVELEKIYPERYESYLKIMEELQGEDPFKK